MSLLTTSIYEQTSEYDHERHNKPAPAAVETAAEERPLIRGADLVIKCLEREGVKLVFAYPGGASLELHQAFTRSRKIRVRTAPS